VFGIELLVVFLCACLWCRCLKISYFKNLK
jgi:hypothetical protein